MVSATPAPLPRAPRRISGPTKAEEQRWRRDAFAKAMAPLPEDLPRAGADTNRAVAEALNTRGVATARRPVEGADGRLDPLPAAGPRRVPASGAPATTAAAPPEEAMSVA